MWQPNRLFSFFFSTLSISFISVFISGCGGEAPEEPPKDTALQWLSPSVVNNPIFSLTYQPELSPVEGYPWRYAIAGADAAFFRMEEANQGLYLDRSQRTDENDDGVYVVLVGAYNDRGDFSSLLVQVDIEPSTQSPDPKPQILKHHEVKWSLTGKTAFDSQGDLRFRAEAAGIQGNPWRYFLSGEDAHLFQIHEQTGEIHIIRPLDPHTTWDEDHDGVYRLLVGAYTDRGDHSAYLVRLDSNSVDWDAEQAFHASLLFPPPNSDLGLNETTQITALVKLQGWSPEYVAGSASINQQSLEYIEGSDNLWRADITLNPGANAIEVRYLHRSFTTTLYNTDLTQSQKPPAVPTSEAARSWCDLKSYATSEWVHISGDYAMDLDRHKFYFMPVRNGYCELDLLNNSVRHVAMGRDLYYPTLQLNPTKDEIFIYETGSILYRSHLISGQMRDYVVLGSHLGGWASDVDMNFVTGEFFSLDSGGFVLGNFKKLQNYQHRFMSDSRYQGWSTMPMPMAITADWTNRKAYIGAMGGAFFSVHIDSLEPTKLFELPIDRQAYMSTALAKDGKGLIIAGPSHGGLFYYDLETGAMESLVEGRGKGLNLVSPSQMEIDETGTVVVTLDERQGQFFAILLLTGDRVAL